MLKIAAIFSGLLVSLFFGRPLGYALSSATFTVNSTGDGADLVAGDGICQTLAVGECTLRAAIQEANAHGNVGGPDEIHFAIPGTGPHTIEPATPLPIITDPVVVDGYTEPGASPNTNGPGLGANTVLMIELKGTGYQPFGCPGLIGNEACPSGLRISAGSSTVRGLVINNFPGRGILIQFGGGNVVEGNFLGTDVAGSVGIGNIYGGVELINSSNNLIGGTAAAARNVISPAMNQAGVLIYGIPSLGDIPTGNLVQGNYIGTNAAGSADVDPTNSGIGVAINEATNNIIGGTTPAERNVISANGSGVLLQFGGGNVVQGNYIGTDVTGSLDLGNSFNGLSIYYASNNTIGGTISGAGNTIAGNNSYGVFVAGTAFYPANANLIQGNVIGTDASGTNAIPNGHAGIRFFDWVTNTVVGGTAPGAGNVIAFNTVFGISLDHYDSSVGNAIRANAIFANNGKGILLGGLGGGDNDARDTDTGPNNLQNFPELVSAASAGGGARVRGRLMTSPGTTVAIDFFANPFCDPSGYGEGQRFLGSTTVTTNPGGIARVDVVLLTAVPAGEFITATATDAAGNTSEFSPCERVD